MLISGGAQLKLYVYALNNRFIYKHGYIIHTNINKHDYTRILQPFRADATSRARGTNWHMRKQEYTQTK